MDPLKFEDVFPIKNGDIPASCGETKKTALWLTNIVME